VSILLWMRPVVMDVEASAAVMKRQRMPLAQ
jgi:hypothetical protein